MKIALEVVFIFLLLIANGVFAMSEIAVVSSRKARLQKRAREGDARSAVALELAEAPDRFFSTIQIGITLIGILAGAFGGATIAEQLGERIGSVPPLAPYGEAIGLVVVVLAITYLSLVVGELVPKRLALNNPEGVASTVARPMRVLSRVAAPAVHLLSASTNAALKLLRARPSTEPPITEEEIRVLVEQGTRAGVFEEAEREMVESIFRLGDRRVGAIMTPRLEIVWLDAKQPADRIKRRIIESHYSSFPVCEGSLDNVLGVIKAKEMLSRCMADEPLDLTATLRQPLFVPESRSALQVLDTFKQSRTHFALVIDEYGAVEGLVTINDILEAIVGDLPLPGGEAEQYAIRREDGSWLLDGALSIDEFKEIFLVGQMPGEERGVYHTLAGFVMTHLGRIPAAADRFEWGGLLFEVLDMDGKRVDKVLVMSAPGGKYDTKDKV